MIYRLAGVLLACASLCAAQTNLSLEEAVRKAESQRPELRAAGRACDRIARSTRHFLEVLDEPSNLKIEFVSFRENIDTTVRWAAPSS